MRKGRKGRRLGKRLGKEALRRPEARKNPVQSTQGTPKRNARRPKTTHKLGKPCRIRRQITQYNTCNVEWTGKKSHFAYMGGGGRSRAHRGNVDASPHLNFFCATGHPASCYALPAWLPLPVWPVVLDVCGGRCYTYIGCWMKQ